MPIFLKMNIEKTEDYYKNLKAKEICKCAYCQNYVREIKKEYKDLDKYLEGIGVDIEKPFETMPLEEKDGYIEYAAVQYIVMGNKESFKESKVGNTTITLADSYPTKDIEEEHFVIEIYPIVLKWTE